MAKGNSKKDSSSSSKGKSDSEKNQIKSKGSSGVTKKTQSKKKGRGKNKFPAHLKRRRDVRSALSKINKAFQEQTGLGSMFVKAKREKGAKKTAGGIKGQAQRIDR